MAGRYGAAAPVLWAIGLGTGIGGPGAARESGAEETVVGYGDAAHSYAFRSPATWRRVHEAPSTASLGPVEAALAPAATLLDAPDRSAELVVLVHGGTSGAGAIRAAERRLLGDETTPVGPLRSSASTIEGVSFGVSQLPLSGSHGRSAYEGLVAAAHGTSTYDVESIPVTDVAPAAATRRDRGRLRAVLASLTPGG